MASNKTIDDVLKVLRKHLSEDKIREVVKELRMVRGNASFLATISALVERVELEVRDANGQ